MNEPLELVLEFDAPGSLKNRKRIWHGFDGRLRLVPNKAAVDGKKAIQAVARAGLAEIRARALPLFADEDVELDMDYLPRSGLVVCRISRAGPRPKGFSGRRRDVQGIPETVCDALEGLVYRNDNQVSRVAIRRLLDP